MEHHTEETLLQYWELIKDIRINQGKKITRKIKHDFLRIMRAQIEKGESSKTPELTRYLYILNTTNGFEKYMDELIRESEKEYDTLEARIIALINEGMLYEGNTSFPEFKNTFSKIHYFNKLNHSKIPDTAYMAKLRIYNKRTENYIKSNTPNRQMADFILFLKLQVLQLLNH